MSCRQRKQECQSHGIHIGSLKELGGPLYTRNGSIVRTHHLSDISFGHMLHDVIFTATCNAVSGDSLYGTGRESIEMARVQRKWRESNENGAGNKFRGASKKFRGAGNKFRDQLPGTYIEDGGYFD